MPHSPLIVVHTSCCEQAALVLKPLASLASVVRDDAFWWLAHNQTSIPCRPSVHASAEASHRHNLGARAGTLQRSSGTRNFVPSESPLRLGHQNDGSPGPHSPTRTGLRVSNKPSIFRHSLPDEHAREFPRIFDLRNQPRCSGTAVHAGSPSPVPAPYRQFDTAPRSPPVEGRKQSGHHTPSHCVTRP